MKRVLGLLSAMAMVQFSGVSIVRAEDANLIEMRKAAFLTSQSCQNVVRSDAERIYIGYGPYLPRENTSGRVQIIEIAHPENKFDLVTQDSVVDIRAVGNRLFVLTFSGIEEWDLATLTSVAKYPTYFTNQPMRYKEHATGFYFYDNQFFISHGRLGFSVFDIRKNRLVDQQRILSEQLPKESMAVDIAGFGDKAILAIDNFTLPSSNQKPAFRGFVVIDLKTHKVIRKTEGLDPGAESIAVLGDDVIVGFNPPLWKFSLDEILHDSSVEPRHIVRKFPSDAGHPIFKAFYDEKYMYGCFLEHGTGRSYYFKPVVMSRKELMLD